jgi:anti-anti-sigma factor
VYTRQADVTDAVPVEVKVTHELCTPALGRFESAVLEALTARPRVLIVDLSRCPGIDAAGIRILLDLHRQLRRGGSRLRVREPSPQVRRVMHIARADQILDIVAAGPADGERDGP